MRRCTVSPPGSLAKVTFTPSSHPESGAACHTAVASLKEDLFQEL